MEKTNQMRGFILLLILILFIYSCGIQSSVKKSFRGKPVSMAEKQLGKPVEILAADGDSVYVFEKISELQSTEINQGKFSHTPIITPKVKKTERFYFSVKNGLIYKTKVEEEYNR